MKDKILHIILVVMLALPLSGIAQEQPPLYKLNELSFNEGSNNEISPTITNDGLLFCSDKRLSGFTSTTSFEGERLFNIWYTKRIDSIMWTLPSEVKSERNALFNNGPMSLAADGETLYFTSEVETGKNSKKRKFKNHRGIYMAKLTGNSEIASMEPFPYNSDTYDVAHPSLSSDGKYLYFASNMSGGFGGSDIYYCELVDGQWGTPTNMGPEINSSYSENYPFIHSSGRLYFTSNRSGGIGGLDVYYATKGGDGWEEAILMQEPINSTNDDFSFVMAEDMSRGYVSSNRGGSDDIFEVLSTIRRKESCDELYINNYCYEFSEENAMKYDTIPFAYKWKFGDGTVGEGSLVDHCYAGPGDYIIQLDVVNLITGETKYNEKSFNLKIEDYEQPYITSDDGAKMNDRIEFSGESTYLPGWEIEQYYWNFGDETALTGEKVTKQFQKPGTYNIQLIVTAKPGPNGEVREACVSKNIVISQ